MIPLVTDWDRPAGLPIAKQGSPTFTSSELPKDATERAGLPDGLSLVRNRITAKSVMGSAPSKSADNSSPSCSLQVKRVAFPATWWLVTTNPSFDMMTPLPVDLAFIILPPEPFSETTSMRTIAG